MILIQFNSRTRRDRGLLKICLFIDVLQIFQLLFNIIEII